MDAIMPGLGAAPALVHFPIALWLAALLFWGLGWLRDDPQLWRVGRWLLYLGILGGVASLVMGYLASEQLGHDSPGHDLVHEHRNLMIATTALASLTGLGAFLGRERNSNAFRGWLLVGLLGTAGLLTVGADRGANLVYRYGMGTLGETPPETHDHGDDGHSHGHERPALTPKPAPEPAPAPAAPAEGAAAAPSSTEPPPAPGEAGEAPDATAAAPAKKKRRKRRPAHKHGRDHPH